MPYDFSVNGPRTAENSGDAQERQLSPKASLSSASPRRNPRSLCEPWPGLPFERRPGHDPAASIPKAVKRRTPWIPLVPSTGGELGLKFSPRPGLNSSACAVGSLHLDSELLFVGDAGNTEATRGSERWGVEFNNFWQPVDAGWRLEADLSWTHARFRGQRAGGQPHPWRRALRGQRLADLRAEPGALRHRAPSPPRAPIR
jgi:hypothetical protein